MLAGTFFGDSTPRTPRVDRSLRNGTLISSLPLFGTFHGSLSLRDKVQVPPLVWKAAGYLFSPTWNPANSALQAEVLSVSKINTHVGAHVAPGPAVCIHCCGFPTAGADGRCSLCPRCRLGPGMPWGCSLRRRCPAGTWRAVVGVSCLSP